MKKEMKRGLALVLVLLMLILPVAAAGSGETELWRIQYSPYSPQSLEVTGEALVLRGIPAGEDHFLVLLEGGGGSYSLYGDRDAGGSAWFSLGEVPPGTYQVNLLKGDAAGTVYSGIGKAVDLTWRGSGGAFRLPEAWSLNEARSAGDSGSAKAQAFFLRPGQKAQSDAPEVRTLAASVTRDCGSAYEKVLAVHDWVAGNIYYDYDALEGRTEYGSQSAAAVLRRKRGVCAGYANLTVALLRAAGVPARYVRGYALRGSEDFPQAVLNGGGEPNHAWVEAWADGRWVVLDPTWDSGNEWRHGRAEESGGCDSHEYFDVAPETFAQNHAVMEKPRYREMYFYVDYEKYSAGGVWKDCTSTGGAPRVIGGTVMVPLAALGREMGGTLQWEKVESGRSRLTWSPCGVHVCLWLDYGKFYVNGEEFRFDVTPRMVNGATLVQARPLLEAMGCVVDWDASADGWGKGRVTVNFGG